MLPEAKASRLAGARALKKSNATAIFDKLCRSPGPCSHRNHTGQASGDAFADTSTESGIAFFTGPAHCPPSSRTFTGLHTFGVDWRIYESAAAGSGVFGFSTAAAFFSQICARLLHRPGMRRRFVVAARPALTLITDFARVWNERRVRLTWHARWPAVDLATPVSCAFQSIELFT
jgi:hypothetical protein